MSKTKDYLMEQEEQVFTACDQRICNCPEWVVLKDLFIIVDDWNEIFNVSIKNVDDLLDSATLCDNAEGVEIFGLHMTKTQLEVLKQDWKKWKDKHKELFN